MVYDQLGKVSVRQVTVGTPEPTFGQVLLQLLDPVVSDTRGDADLYRTHSGVCHSDHGLMINAVRRPISPRRYLIPDTLFSGSDTPNR